ncbi:MAG: hypothetical protein WDN69_20745 [Aliidongia sp.]
MMAANRILMEPAKHSHDAKAGRRATFHTRTPDQGKAANFAVREVICEAWIARQRIEVRYAQHGGLESVA